MRQITIMITIALISMVYLSSCSKDDDISNLPESKKESKMINARLNNQMSNTDMEREIKDFLKKMGDTTSLSTINYIEAFEYIEASLNYRYVNYDYSKCAELTTFNGSIEISVKEDETMDMNNLRLAYNLILNDWKSKYNSITESEKTPIVFDITDVKDNTVNYTMVVGHGNLNLDEWGEGFVPLATTDFGVAAAEYHAYLLYYLNDLKQQFTPFDYRVYLPVVGIQQYPIATNLPSYVLDIYPAQHGMTDYLLFYSDNAYNNFHTDLNQNEYNFYRDNLYPIINNFLSTHSSNYASLSFVYPYHTNNSSGNPYKVWHGLRFYHGVSFYSSEALWTL